MNMTLIHEGGNNIKLDVLLFLKIRVFLKEENPNMIE